MIRIVLASVAALIALTPPARAQTRLELEITPFGGGVLFLGDGPTFYTLKRTGAEPLKIEGAHYDDSWTAGLNVGLRVNEYFSVETLLAWVPTWLSGTNLVEGTDVYAYMYGLSGVVRVPVSASFRPYWGIGVGAKSYDHSGSIHTQTQWMTTFVAGVSFDVGYGQSIRIQGRDLLAPFDAGLPGVRGGWENDLMLTAGVSWRVPLGRNKPQVERSRRGRGGLFPG